MNDKDQVYTCKFDDENEWNAFRDAAIGYGFTLQGPSEFPSIGWDRTFLNVTQRTFGFYLGKLPCGAGQRIGRQKMNLYVRKNRL